MSSIFSVFSHGSTRKSSGSMSPAFTTPEPSPTRHQFPSCLKNDNRKSSGSQISASQLGIPGVDGHRSVRNSPGPASPSHPRRGGEIDRPTSLSPTSVPFPSLDTQARISPTTIPSQKFLSQMPRSLALRTATISTPLPVVKPAGPSQTQQKSKMRNRLFGGSNKPPTSPTAYELAGRSTFALVHGAILRYHSAFGLDQNDNAPPDSTHFLNGESIVCVTDAIQGFKWVLEVKTWSKGLGIRSPIKKTKSARNLAEKKVDLNQLPWGVVDNLQAWYLVFENPNLMTEWMTQLRAAVHGIKERELRCEKSTPKPPKASRTPSKENRKKSKAKSPQVSSPTSTITESLPSSPASSRKSFPRVSLDGITSQRNSIVDVVNARRPSTATQRQSGSSFEDTGPVQLRRRQPSQQDIALTAFRISALEEDLASFVPPSATDQSTPELKITSPSLKSDTEPAHSAAPPTPNMSHYANKRASIISLQSRLSSLSSSSPRTPRTAVSPSASPNPPRHRRTLRRTISGESSRTSTSWKHLQNVPPPHPPPTGPLPTPPSQPNYIPRSGLTGADLFSSDGESLCYDPRESMILGISPVFEADTPNTLLQATPRSSPLIEPSPLVGLSGGDTMPAARKVAVA